MTKDELIKELSGTIGKRKVTELTRILEQQAFALRDLVDLTFHEDKDIAFRAAWILENLILQRPVAYTLVLDYILLRFNDVKYPSCQRHYAKIIMHLTTGKSPVVIKEKLDDIDLEPVVERCFDWLIDPKVLVAVKVFAAEALFNLHHRYPWIKEELGAQVTFLMKTGTAAMQSRGRKLLAALNA